MADSNSIRNLLRAEQLCEVFEQDKRQSDTIVVVDLHKRWSGPCIVMQAAYSSLIDAIENGSSRVVLAALSMENLSSWLEEGNDGKRTNQQSMLTYDPTNQQNRDKKFFRGIRADMSPSEVQKLSEFLQACSGSCKPQTLFFRVQPLDKVEFPVTFTASVHGADAPQVAQTFRTVSSQCVF